MRRFLKLKAFLLLAAVVVAALSVLPSLFPDKDMTLKVDGASSLYRLQGYVIPEHTPWPTYSAFGDEGSDDGEEE